MVQLLAVLHPSEVPHRLLLQSLEVLQLLVVQLLLDLLYQVPQVEGSAALLQQVLQHLAQWQTLHQQPVQGLEAFLVKIVQHRLEGLHSLQTSNKAVHLDLVPMFLEVAVTSHPGVSDYTGTWRFLQLIPCYICSLFKCSIIEKLRVYWALKCTGLLFVSYLLHEIKDFYFCLIIIIVILFFNFMKNKTKTFDRNKENMKYTVYHWLYVWFIFYRVITDSLRMLYKPVFGVYVHTV